MLPGVRQPWYLHVQLHGVHPKNSVANMTQHVSRGHNLTDITKQQTINKHPAFKGPFTCIGKQKDFSASAIGSALSWISQH